MKLLFPLLFLAACSDKAPIPPAIPAFAFTLSPSRQVLGSLSYPGRQEVKLEFRNVSDKPLNITGISGSCACQSFRLGSELIPNSKSGASVEVLPGEEVPVSFTTNIKPGLQSLQVRVFTDQEFPKSLLANVMYFGDAEMRIVPPVHNFGRVELGSKHKWKTRIVSTSAKPFRLDCRDPDIKVTPEPFCMAWIVEGEVIMDKETKINRSVRLYTDNRRVPELSIAIIAYADKKVELPPLVSLAVKDDGSLNYRFKPIYHDTDFRPVAAVTQPLIAGLVTKVDGDSIVLSGNPVVDGVVRSNLVLSFPGNYPDRSVKLTIFQRRK